MRTIRKEFPVYKFHELPEDVKDKAIDALYDINVDHEWWEYVYQDASDIGVEIKEFDIDRGHYCKIRFKGYADEIADAILRSHGNTCETYKTAESAKKSSVLRKTSVSLSPRITASCFNVSTNTLRHTKPSSRRSKLTITNSPKTAKSTEVHMTKYISSIVTKYGDQERVKADVKTIFEILDRQGSSLIIDALAEYVADRVRRLKVGERERIRTRDTLVDELDQALTERL
jgi:hypothetical protein